MSACRLGDVALFIPLYISCQSLCLSGILKPLSGFTVKVWLGLKILLPQSSTWVIYKASYRHSQQSLHECAHRLKEAVYMAERKERAVILMQIELQSFFNCMRKTNSVTKRHVTVIGRLKRLLGNNKQPLIKFLGGWKMNCIFGWH